MKLFLITGAGQGLGRQLARDFDQEEVHLLLFGRTFEKLAKTRSEISHAMVDIIDVDLVQYEEVLQKLDRFDFSIYEEVVLINNAATWTGGVSIKEIFRILFKALKVASAKSLKVRAFPIVKISCTNIVGMSKFPVLASAHKSGVRPNKLSCFGKTVKSIFPRM